MRVLPANMIEQMTSKEKMLEPFKGKLQATRAHVFLGTKCSYHCKFCYGNGKRDAEFFPIEQVKEYIDFLYRYGIDEIEYTGGEPTECSYLPELVEWVRDTYNMRQCIITNGSGENYHDLYLKGVEEFLFSLHGFNKESHNFITGKYDAWEKINKSMKEVESFQSALLRINVTICKYNYLFLEEQAKYIIDNFPTVFQVNYLPMNSWDEATKYEDISVPYDEYATILDKAVKVIRNNPFRRTRIAIRYIPYCKLSEDLHPYIYTHIHHAYDDYDWNQELDGRTIRYTYLDKPYGYYTVPSILNKRKSLYTKFDTCLKCNKFHICDGFQTNQLKREGLI